MDDHQTVVIEEAARQHTVIRFKTEVNAAINQRVMHL